MSLRDLRDYPGLFPGIAVSVLIALAASQPLGRVLQTSRLLAFGVVLAFGLVVSATATPSADALRYGTVGSGLCDLSRLTVAPLREMLSLTDAGTNVALLIPLGLVIGLLPNTRAKICLLGVSVALPVAVESIQLLVIRLGRQCQSADVVDNLVGLTVGLAIGSLLRWIIESARPATLRP